MKYISFKIGIYINNFHNLLNKLIMIILPLLTVVVVVVVVVYKKIIKKIKEIMWNNHGIKINIKIVLGGIY